MKTKLFFLAVMFIVGISLASAGQNSIIDNIRLGLGMDHNEFNITVKDNARFGDQFRMDAKYDADIEWLIDGNVVRKAKGVRISVFVPNTEMLPPKDPMHITGYKAGKDPITKQMRHLIELKYQEGTKRWVISE